MIAKQTTFSTGFDKSKLYTYISLVKYFKNDRQVAYNDYHGVFESAKQAIEEYTDKKPDEARILEVGCGQRFAVTLLFHSIGAHVTGIDTDYVDPKYSLKGLMGIWRSNGFERFAKTAVRHYAFDRAYYSTLEKELGRPLKVDDKLDIRLMNACDLQFEDNEFDFIVSNAVFEHIDNVDKATSEIARVLKPGGVFKVGVHLYSSLSGGHCLEWSSPDDNPSRKVPPWDHLRQNMYPTHVYLNKLKDSDYLEIFRKYFTVLDLKETYEGENLLTDEILEELPGYTREQLLKRNIKVILKK